MSIRASRATRLLMAAALAWLGLALCAQAAQATYGKIQVAKVNQGGNANDTFTFHPSVTPSASDFSIKGGESSSALQIECNIDRPNQPNECSRWGYPTLEVTEQPKPGYTLTDITCRFTQGTSAFGVEPTTSSPVKPASEVTKDLTTGTVSLKVHWYEWVKCFYTNTKQPDKATPPPPAEEPPTNTPPVTPPVVQPAVSPQIKVSPSRIKPGSAKLSGPRGCPTTNVVAATVTGKRIVKVTFYVDGKKVKTLTRANKGSRWVLPLNVRHLAYGSHRVRAKVQFAKSSTTQTKTMRLSFSRCGAAAAQPQFTG
jgi:hypothetical protein